MLRARHFLLVTIGLLPVRTLAQNEPNYMHPVEPLESELNSFAVVERNPKPLNLTEVQRTIGYPKAAQQQGIEGKVVVRVLVDEQGRTVKHVVIESPDPLLTEAVVSALPKLTWKPAIQKKKPIMCWVTLPFHFKLPASVPKPD